MTFGAGVVCSYCVEAQARLAAAERAEQVGLDEVAIELRRQALRWIEIDNWRDAS